MGFFKELGALAGGITGIVVGGAVHIAGEVTDSKFLKEVAEGVYQASAKSGELLGEMADGTANAVVGLVTQDDELINKGGKEFSRAAEESITRIGKGIAYTATKGINTLDAVLDGDTDKAIECGKDLIKIAAIGALSVGVIDFLDGPDGVDDSAMADAPDEHVTLIDNPNVHSVEPHLRTYADGSSVWVDGDGDTSVHRDTGWVQHNPDYRKG